MTDKKISIIVPIYNLEKYLENSLDSLLAQTYKNLEIILVDDGSNDASAQICDDFAKKDDRVNVIHKKNAGVSAARNSGLKSQAATISAFLTATTAPTRICLSFDVACPKRQCRHCDV